MRWTNMTEKDMLKAWAKEEYTPQIVEKYLPQPDVKCESYWEKCDDDCDIAEFGFDTIPEQVEDLKETMSDERYKDILLPLAVATFKEKKDLNIERVDEGDNQKNIKDNKDAFEIPEFVYAF